MKKLLLCFIGFLLSVSLVKAQFNFIASGGQNVSGTYTDLGSLGTVIDTNYLGDPITYDDDVSRLTAIGFSFNYNGGSYTQFFLGSNGYIKLANNAAFPPDPFSIGVDPDYLNAPDSNLIAPYCYDLDAGASTPEYRVYTSGTAGSRICTIQYKNVRDYGFSQYANMNFQIKLYEANGNIEFVYGAFQSSAASPSLISPFVGVKGNTDISSVNLTKSSSQAWSTAAFIDGPYGASNPFNNRNNALPDAGRTFRFISTPPPANDAEVQFVYTLGELPLIYGVPHVVSARIRNKGTNTLNNLAVSLSITGANSFSNTQIISSLAPGASFTVPFSAFSPVSSGTNTITVSVPSDDLNTNNSKTATQQMSAGTFSYADNSAIVGAVGAGTGSGLILTRYFMNGTAQVTAVAAHISADNRNIGKTIYAVVMNNLGSIIDSSAFYVIQAGDLGTYKQLDIITPRSITNSFYYAGIAQVALVGDPLGYYPVSYQDEGNPTRSLAYYEALISGGGLVQQNTLGRFMIKAILNNTIVPVNMRAFTATRNGSMNELRWEISSEINVTKYIIERSERGNGGFSSIGTVMATGSSAYNFTDMQPIRGMNFYRLRALDMDGRETISEIRSVKNEGRNQLIVYPNPVGERLNMTYYSEKAEEAVLMIFNDEGRRLYMRKLNLPAGTANIVLDDIRLAAGSYSLELLTSGNRHVQRILKQ